MLEQGMAESVRAPPFFFPLEALQEDMTTCARFEIALDSNVAASSYWERIRSTLTPALWRPDVCRPVVDPVFDVTPKSRKDEHDEEGCADYRAGIADLCRMRDDRRRR